MVFKINNEDKILIIAPHPEDIVIASGGFISKYAKQIDLLCVIPYKENLDKYSEVLSEAFSAITEGICNRVYVGKAVEYPDINAYYEDYISNINMQDYDIILAPNRDDNKSDQKFAGNDFLKTMLEKQGYKENLQILRYELWNPLKTANYYEDITDVLDQKRALISKYKNDNNYITQIINMNMFRAFTSCYNTAGKHVEAYYIDDLSDFLQISDVINETTEQNFQDKDVELLLKGQNIQKIIDNFVEQNKGKRVVLYKAGNFLRYIYRYYSVSGVDIIGVSDERFEQNREHEFYGLNCIKLSDLKNTDCDVIAIADNDFIKSYDSLYRIIKDRRDIKVVPLIKKEFGNKICARPFHTLSVLPSGHCITCCAAYIQNYTIGNIIHEGFKEVWNSKRAQTLRELLIDKDYSICDMNTCIQYEPVEENNISDYYESADIVKMPDTIYMGWDYDCNVACITCRNNLIKNNEETLSQLKSIEAGVLEACKTAKLFYTSGNGDPFGSSYSRELIKKVAEVNPDIKFFIHTNGVLCTEKQAEELGIKDRIVKVIFSIHSACKETYDKIVRYGNYERVMQNAEWISKLKQKGQVDTFILAFVVHKLNYKDMPDFVRIAEKLGATASFRYYRQWANNTEYQYDDMAVFDENHSEHPQLLSVLKDDIFNSQNCKMDAKLMSLREKAKRM